MFKGSIAMFALTIGLAGLTAGAQSPTYTVEPSSTTVHFFIFGANEKVAPQRPLQGRVITTERTPLVNATVSLMVNGTNEVISTTRTDSTGSYKLNVPPEGKYALRVRSLGFTPVTVPIEDENANTSNEITMRAFDKSAAVATAQP